MPIADIGSVRLHYRIDGTSDQPTLVLLHSLGTDLSLWDNIVENLSSDYYILRFDLRGHGASSVPSGPYQLSDFCDDLIALLDSFNLTIVQLAGASLGAMIAMWLAINFPSRCGSLILANTASRIGTVEGWEGRIAHVLTSGMTEVAQGAGNRWFTSTFRQSHAEEASRFTSLLASTSPNGYAASCAALRDTDLTSDLSRIHAPALIVAGSCDPVTPPACGRHLQSAITGARYIELPASHLSAVELPDEFSNAVCSFLQEEEPRHG